MTGWWEKRRILFYVQEPLRALLEPHIEPMARELREAPPTPAGWAAFLYGYIYSRISQFASVIWMPSEDGEKLTPMVVFPLPEGLAAFTFTEGRDLIVAASLIKLVVGHRRPQVTMIKRVEAIRDAPT